MTQLSFVGLSGNITTPSKTRNLTARALELTGELLDIRSEIFEINDFGPELGTARRIGDLSPEAQDKVARLLAADALVVATPIYKGSYTGLFKHLIDLLDPSSLLRKPILIAATGGGDRHALAVEHQLRPLFAFFEARVLATAVHVSDRDFTEGQLTGAAANERLARAVEEFGHIFPAAAKLKLAAE